MGSPERSPRSTRVLTKNPISPSISTPVAAGHGGAHREVVLPADAREQGLEAGQEHHEERRSLAPAQGLGLPDEVGRQAHRPGGAAVALHRGPRAVGGQLQERRQPGELPPPEGDLLLQDLAAAARSAARPRSPRTVPAAPAGATAGPRRGPDRARRPRAPGAHGPAVARDVVHGEHGRRGLPRRGAAAGRAAAGYRWARSNGRPASSPARASAPVLARALRQPREVDHGQPRKGRPAGSPAPACPASRDEDGAQSLVAAHDLAEAAGQHRGVERPFDAQRRRDVVERAPRLDLVDEPEPLLGERQGQGPLRAAPAAGAERAAPRRSRSASASTRAARSASTGASKRSRSGISTPKAWRRRDVTCVASREWPPRSKK